MSDGLVKASVLYGVGDLRVECRVLPGPQADEVQVAVQATGLCGSDLHYFDYYRNGDIVVREPLTLGHESAGVVNAVGSNVRGLSVGDRVALEVGVPCQRCHVCSQGRYNICRGLRFRGSAKAYPHFQGTLQERINHPARWCHRLPEGLGLEHGALVEPLSVAIHACRRAQLQPGATVLVLGAGAVGLLCAALGKASAAKTVIIADILAGRVNFAVENGFADVALVVPMERPQTVEDKLAYAQHLADQVKALKGGGEPVGEVTVSFECTGIEACLQTAIFVGTLPLLTIAVADCIQATQAGGKVMMIGMGNPIQTLPISAAARSEVDLLGVFRYANTYPAAMELLGEKPAGLPDIGKLVTHRYKGLDKISDAFSMARKVKDDEGNVVLKVMVDMS